MSFRQQWEEVEQDLLSSHATLACNSKGRTMSIEPCGIRTCFQRDRDRILHSKAFRRLKHKTQVFIAPAGDHYRTRLTHTLEVAQISRTIGRALRLNEDLIEAIALGHDLGHTPFGHAGEAILNELLGHGFEHNKQSLRIIDCLEGGTGLNCTFEVRDGIVNHTGTNEPSTPEGRIVRIADRIGYINHDIDDALRAGILTLDQLPVRHLEILGYTHSHRINTMVTDIINHSKMGNIQMSKSVFRAMDELRDFLFDFVYVGSVAKREEYKAKALIQRIFRYYYDQPEHLPKVEQQRLDSNSKETVIADHVSGMTDRYILSLYEDLFLPRPWPLKLNRS